MPVVGGRIRHAIEGIETVDPRVGIEFLEASRHEESAAAAERAELDDVAGGERPEKEANDQIEVGEAHGGDDGARLGEPARPEEDLVLLQRLEQLPELQPPAPLIPLMDIAPALDAAGHVHLGQLQGHGAPLSIWLSLPW